MPSDAVTASGVVLTPDWPAPARVGAMMSTRVGGVSLASFDSLNLGSEVGDDLDAVTENRRRFAALLGASPVWLRQVHGNRVLRLHRGLLERPAQTADAAWTDEPGLACAVQVADCLPVLMAAPDGRAVAAAHAGWRGLAAGVIDASLAALCAGAHCSPADVVAWLGPCIGPRQFEVGADVLAAFEPSLCADEMHRCFVPRGGHDGTLRWLADLPRLARLRLASTGVRRVSGGTWCTVEDRSRFFSYRRDGVTGRLAAAVFLHC